MVKITCTLGLWAPSSGIHQTDHRPMESCGWTLNRWIETQSHRRSIKCVKDQSSCSQKLLLANDRLPDLWQELGPGSMPLYNSSFVNNLVDSFFFNTCN